MLKLLVHEDLELLFIIKLTDMPCLICKRHSTGIDVFVHSFPVPLVDLVLFHPELLGQLDAHLFRRDLPLVLLESLPQDVDLFAALALSIIVFSCLATCIRAFIC